MNFHPFILAEEDIGKLVGFIVIAVIWGIGALSSMISKASKKAIKGQAFRPAPATPAMPAKAQPMQPARRVAPPQPRTPAPAPRVSAGTVAVAPQRTQGVSQIVAKPAPAPAAKRPAATAPVLGVKASVARGVANTTKAATIRRWLQPESLRKQFILTELLQPPIAMRPPQDS